MAWTFFFLFVVLKLPVVAALWLIWYATRPMPTEPVDGLGDGGGGSGHHRPRRPRPPRRGPHAAQALPSPPRVRAVSRRALTRHR